MLTKYKPSKVTVKKIPAMTIVFSAISSRCFDVKVV
jgi:hypothetical protein